MNDRRTEEEEEGLTGWVDEIQRHEETLTRKVRATMYLCMLTINSDASIGSVPGSALTAVNSRLTFHTIAKKNSKMGHTPQAP